MTPEALTKLLDGYPWPATCAILMLACLGLFVALMKGHARERDTLIRVAKLTDALVPVLAEKKARKRRGDTGAHAVVTPEEPP